MSTNGTVVVTARNGADKDQDNVSLSHSEVLKQKVKSSSSGLAAKEKREYTPREIDSLKLIGQHLLDLGLPETAKLLAMESNCPPDHPLGTRFQLCILSGSWEEAHKTMDELEELVDRPEDKKVMHQILAEERYMELIESGNHIDALRCLRFELASYFGQTSEIKLKNLSLLLMVRDKKKLQMLTDWPGVEGGSRQKALERLQSYLPASIMLPPRRLQTIYSQALQQQVEHCLYHCHTEDMVSSYSLLNDHSCSRHQLPCVGIHVLRDHKDEVWFVKFSHNGKRLSSVSKDGEVILWNTVGVPTKLHSIKIPGGQGVAGLAWSPDDQHLLVCGADDERHVHVYNAETGQLKSRVAKSDEDCLTCCAWQTNSTFYCGGLKGHFYESSTEGVVMESWEGVRVQAICTHPSSKEAIVADSHHRIKSYNFQEPKVTPLVQEEQPIMSMSISSDGNYLLVNVSNHSLRLWNIKDCNFVERYHGPTQGFYTIHSCFGGLNESFLASGSEDNLVYIWNRRSSTPVLKLEGHTRTVNCVSWNPVNHEMLASCSDDGTVHIWGSKRYAAAMQQKAQCSRNGKQHPSDSVEGSSSMGQRSLHLEEKSLEEEEQGDSLQRSSDQLTASEEEEDSYNESGNNEDDDEESDNDDALYI